MGVHITIEVECTPFSCLVKVWPRLIPDATVWLMGSLFHERMYSFIFPWIRIIADISQHLTGRGMLIKFPVRNLMLGVARTAIKKEPDEAGSSTVPPRGFEPRIR
ncbi:hypothetical protein BBOMB_0093 [Bifidobacterium bombi DSM 19703]|uniref:Uncharacterized protein n=1 Tax=Bifidobacterium bombi DSM 19703 TaxID=1341695 RepID=A0A080N1S6_9BIFI|nr:hypothetical protein BBOMB_0093 [Bifidobacterium bombi DSM 19703]